MVSHVYLQYVSQVVFCKSGDVDSQVVRPFPALSMTLLCGRMIYIRLEETDYDERMTTVICIGEWS
jgi:hypothetical protein